MTAGENAVALGDAPLALQLCDQALAAETRLGPTAGAHLAVASSSLRASVAQSAGAIGEAVDHHLEGARLALADDLPGVAAVFLGAAAQDISWVDPAGARRHGTEGLALARESGMPIAIVANLSGLAQAMAADDPEQARALLFESRHLATTLGYENPGELAVAVLTAGRLDEWPTMLRVAGRVFHHYVRSGGLGLPTLAIVLNLVARGLAEHQAESAAVLQGAHATIMGRLVAASGAPPSGGTVGANLHTFGAFMMGVRGDTEQLLTAALGVTRLDELRAQGAAMDEAQTCAYARTHIDEYFADVDEQVR
jgi:hypothetical protein